MRSLIKYFKNLVVEESSVTSLIVVSVTSEIVVKGETVPGKQSFSNAHIVFIPQLVHISGV